MPVVSAERSPWHSDFPSSPQPPDTQVFVLACAIRRLFIYYFHSKTVMLSLSHQRSVNARWGLFTDARRQCSHECVHSDECYPMFTTVTMPWLCDSLSMTVPLSSLRDNTPMSQIPSWLWAIWLVYWSLNNTVRNSHLIWISGTHSLKAGSLNYK